jgi:hypothetical protein
MLSMPFAKYARAILLHCKRCCRLGLRAAFSFSRRTRLGYGSTQLSACLL